MVGQRHGFTAFTVWRRTECFNIKCDTRKFIFKGFVSIDYWYNAHVYHRATAGAKANV